MMFRLLALLLLAAVSAPAAIFQCIEFPYYAFPRQLWDRELVWMKNIGIRSVAFTVPPDGSEQDLLTILRTLRKLEMTAWVRGAAEIPAQSQAHGGPVVYWGEKAVPQPVIRLSALSPTALAHSREALSGTMLWTDVETTIAPEFHKGAISLTGEELPTLSQLRRQAVLLDYWAPGIDAMKPMRPLLTPGFVTARELLGAASALSVVNRGKLPYRASLRVFYPPAKRTIALPAFTVQPNDALWLPINIPLAKGPFCRNCDAFGNTDSLIYATAELTGIEYENGILALEFNAPTAGEVLLHLAKQPSGPLLAAGHPTSFDWDEASGRAKLPIPAGRGAGNRVRIGLALDPPDSSAFFGDTKVLIVGQQNRIATTYSSEEIAKRSRLRAPAWLKAAPLVLSPLEIAYDLTVPPATLHGDHVELALEADGVQMGHTRVQFLRPASLRIREAVNRHFGNSAEIAVDPPLVPMADEKAGRDISVIIRNNYPEIKNYVLELFGEGLEFSPARAEVAIAASSERDVSFRVFPSKTGLLAARMHLSGAATLDAPAQFVVIPRGGTVAYTADFDGDGRPESILESQKARVVFSGDRWLEFDWKDSERNVLPASGIVVAGAHPVLNEAELSLDAPEALKPGKQGDIVIRVQEPAPNRTVYTLSR